MNRWLKWALLGGFLMVLASTCARAMNISAPHDNYTYYSSAVRVEYSTNLTDPDCYYYLNGQSLDTTAIEDCITPKLLIVPYNAGAAHITVCEQNGTATNCASVTVNIDNTTTPGRGVLLTGVMLVFILLPFVFFFPAFNLHNLHFPVKLLLLGMGLFCVWLALFAGRNISEHHIHDGLITDTLDAVLTGYTYVFYMLLSYLCITLVFGIIGWMASQRPRE